MAATDKADAADCELSGCSSRSISTIWSLPAGHPNKATVILQSYVSLADSMQQTGLSWSQQILWYPATTNTFTPLSCMLHASPAHLQPYGTQVDINAGPRRINIGRPWQKWEFCMYFYGSAMK
eukprot:1746977-Amphidinium_carterae.1